MNPYIVELWLKIVPWFLLFLNWFLSLSPSKFRCGGSSKSISTSSSLGFNFEKKKSNAWWYRAPSFEAHVRVRIISLWPIKDINSSSKVCVVGPLYHRTYLYWISQLACQNRIFVPCCVVFHMFQPTSARHMAPKSYICTTHTTCRSVLLAFSFDILLTSSIVN